MSNAALYHTQAGYEASMAWYERILSRLTTPYESIFVDTRHGKTHLLAFGRPDAPALLLIHGTQGNALQWQPQFEMLSQYYRLIALDKIGSAGKSAPTRLPYAGWGYAEWLLDVLDGLRIQRAAVAGISGGGYMTLKLGAFAPDRVSHIILMSPTGFERLRLPYGFSHNPRFVQISGKLMHWFASRNMARKILIGLSPDGTVDEDFIDHMLILMKHLKNQANEPPLPDAELARCTMPALVLLGEHEKVFDIHRVIARAQATLPGLVAAEIIAGVGHGMNGENADLINTRIHRFLETGT